MTLSEEVTLQNHAGTNFKGHLFTEAVERVEHLFRPVRLKQRELIQAQVGAPAAFSHESLQLEGG